MSFSGWNGERGDNLTASEIINGHLPPQLLDVKTFLDESLKAAGTDIKHVTLNGHSTGSVPAIYANWLLQHNKNISSDVTALEPFGAHRSIDKLAELIGNAENDSSPENVSRIKGELAENVTSIRSRLPTYYSATPIGETKDGNDPVGKNMQLDIPGTPGTSAKAPDTTGTLAETKAAFFNHSEVSLLNGLYAFLDKSPKIKEGSVHLAAPAGQKPATIDGSLSVNEISGAFSPNRENDATLLNAIGGHLRENTLTEGHSKEPDAATVRGGNIIANAVQLMHSINELTANARFYSWELRQDVANSLRPEIAQSTKGKGRLETPSSPTDLPPGASSPKGRDR